MKPRSMVKIYEGVGEKWRIQLQGNPKTEAAVPPIAIYQTRRQESNLNSQYGDNLQARRTITDVGLPTLGVLAYLD
jgi:hypothetical protein